MAAAELIIFSWNIYLTQHAQCHVDGRQQRTEGRSHFRVKCWSGEAEHKQGSVLGQVHTLNQKQRNTSGFASSDCSACFMFIHVKHNLNCRTGIETWSRSIWQQSGVKCWSVARVLLRIFRRLHCTASKAFPSASSLSPPSGFLDGVWGVWGVRCVRGRGAGGNASPFLAWKIPKARQD